MLCCLREGVAHGGREEASGQGDGLEVSFFPIFSLGYLGTGDSFTDSGIQVQTQDRQRGPAWLAVAVFLAFDVWEVKARRSEVGSDGHVLHDSFIWMGMLLYDH